jgi:hypothetical protein
VLYRIAREDHGIGLLLIDVSYATSYAIGPQRSRGLIRCGCQYVRIAELRYEQSLTLVDDVTDGRFLHLPLVYGVTGRAVHPVYY